MCETAVDGSLFVCERCRVHLQLCEGCDEGQRFCRPCAAEQRRDSRHRYWHGNNGKRKAAKRQADYRRRRGKFSEQKVTHRRVTQSAEVGMLGVTKKSELPSVRKDPDEISPMAREETPRCFVCGRLLSGWVCSRRQRSMGMRRRAGRFPPPARGP